MGGLPMEMSIPSLFDPLPSHHNNAQIKKEMVKSESQDAFGLTDKKPPLNVVDQKPSMPGFVPGQTGFKVKPDVKNASSWSSLAKANSPQGNSAANSSKQQVSRLLLVIFNRSKLLEQYLPKICFCFDRVVTTGLWLSKVAYLLFLAMIGRADCIYILVISCLN